MFNENILIHTNFKKEKKFPLALMIFIGIFVLSMIIVINETNFFQALFNSIRMFINSRGF